jgi:large subunit ribosomal protein L25
VSTRPTLSAEARVITGKKVRGLRRAGALPAVVYGHGVPSESIQIDAHDWEVLRREHVGRNSLIDLTVGSGRVRPVLVHGIDEDRITRRPLHVDFLAVRMTEEIAIDVPVALVGSSELVERQSGTLLHLRDTVHVRALPADLPSVLELDVTAITDFETTLHVRDLQVPPRVTVMTDSDEAVARIQPPRIEAEPVAVGAEAPAETAETPAPAPGAPAEGESSAG